MFHCFPVCIPNTFSVQGVARKRNDAMGRTVLRTWHSPSRYRSSKKPYPPEAVSPGGYGFFMFVFFVFCGARCRKNSHEYIFCNLFPCYQNICQMFFSTLISIPTWRSFSSSSFCRISSCRASIFRSRKAAMSAHSFNSRLMCGGSCPAYL